MEVKKTPSGLKFMEADGGASPPHQRVFWWLLRGGEWKWLFRLGKNDGLGFAPSAAVFAQPAAISIPPEKSVEFGEILEIRTPAGPVFKGRF
jgi:hypothetical protein